MEREALVRIVEGHARERLGFDLFGAADALDPEFERAPAGHKPTEYLPGARSVISLGLRVLDAALQTTPSPIYQKHYITVNEQLNSGAYRLCRFIEDLGYRCITFPETDPYPYYLEQQAQGMERYIPSFSHIAAAIAAGHGRRGRVGVLLTPRFGPRQRFITIITTAPLAPSPRFEGSLCLDQRKPGSCEECLKACPVGR